MSMALPLCPPHRIEEAFELMQQEVDLLEHTRKVGPRIPDRVYVDSNILLDS